MRALLVRPHHHKPSSYHQACLSLSDYVTSCRSHLFNKLPAIYNSLEGVPVDFFNKDDDSLDPYSSLHTEEEKLVSENPSEVSKEAMWLNIRSVFSQSKTGKTNEKVSDRDHDSFVTKNAVELRNSTLLLSSIVKTMKSLSKYISIKTMTWQFRHWKMSTKHYVMLTLNVLTILITLISH